MGFIVVNDIKWERSNLILELNEKVKSCEVIGKKNFFIPAFKDNIIKICVTNINESSIEEDSWNIEVNGECVKIIDELLPKLDDKSRIFKYRRGYYALTITFNVLNNDAFVLESSYYMKNNKYKKYIRLNEGNKIKEKVQIVLKLLMINLINAIYNLIFIFNSKKNNILFLSENSDELSGNLKSLYNYLDTKKEYSIYVWNYNLYKKNSKILRIKELIFLGKSKYVFVDNYVSLYNIIKKNKNQILVQLWHAGIGFKAVGYARFGKENSPHAFVSSHRQYDYAIVDKKELTDTYKEVFGISQNKIISCGMPRLENYINKYNIKHISNNLIEKYPIIKNKKVILFAPTYRGESAENAYYDFSNINLDEINNFCELNKFIFVLKNHPFIKNKLKIKNKYQNNIVDLSHENINDLLFITDILITDYSSCAYEYSYFNRPLIFYRFDKYLYEFKRPMHTINFFSKCQYEVETFDDLMTLLKKMKNVNCKQQFNNVVITKNESCQIIEKIILKGEEDVRITD